VRAIRVALVAVIAFVFAALSSPAAYANTKADVDAFNDTLAAQTSACQSMIRIVNVISDANRAAAPGLVEWSMTANSAKACGFKVHAETSQQAPARFVKVVLRNACAHVKTSLSKTKSDTYAAETSWACGWPSPLPRFRPVPGIMPPS
jgi:hypothetical protein